MIGNKELQRCRRTRPRSDRLGFRKIIRDTHVHTPYLIKHYLPVCLHLPAHPAFRRLPVSLRANGILLNNFRPIWVIQSPAQKYSAFPHPQISGFFCAVPSRQEGRIARRHERGTGCDGRGSVRREACLQGEQLVSVSRRAGRTAACSVSCDLSLWAAFRRPAHRAKSIWAPGPPGPRKDASAGLRQLAAVMLIGLLPLRKTVP